jgi:hypothetical protein
MSKDFVKNSEGTSQTDGNGEEKEYSFDDLFAEANGLSASADSGNDIVGVEGTTDGTTNGSAPDNTNDGQDSGQSNGDSQVGDSDPNSNQAGTEDYKAMYEKEVQRTSSWNGRLSAKDREIRALQQQIADLTAKVETASKVTATKQEGEEADEAVSEFLKEFPELAGPIQKMIEKATKQRTDEVVSSLTERFNKTISPIAETVQETALERLTALLPRLIATSMTLFRVESFRSGLKSSPHLFSLQCSASINRATLRRSLTSLRSTRRKLENLILTQERTAQILPRQILNALMVKRLDKNTAPQCVPSQWATHPHS